MEITASNSEYPETPKNPFIKEYGINYSRIPNMILEVLSRGGGARTATDGHPCS